MIIFFFYFGHRESHKVTKVKIVVKFMVNLDINFSSENKN